MVSYSRAFAFIRGSEFPAGSPGHFHAALTLRKRHPYLNDDVYVYAEDGPDVESFLRMVRTFNERPSQPTRWNLHVHRGADFMEKLRKDRAGDVVIVAGKNDAKMRTIHELHADGFFVLGDKPWLIGADELPMLSEAATTRPLAMDIMTERHEITNRVQKALADRPEVFGRFRTDGGEPAIHMESRIALARNSAAARTATARARSAPSSSPLRPASARACAALRR